MKNMVGWFALLTGLAFCVLITGFVFLLLEMQVFDKTIVRRKSDSSNRASTIASIQSSNSILAQPAHR